ncbi:nucleosome-remodeling factor subunit BPTF-like [Camellia sinensis]|uniref:nucleosome-remodeling factor subunit BPTF-like n=1 Tax=Camellia sinensis TaxID=4442 RepID=UPI0010356FE0|nr:nucleosome-remodeling factor subunit BPTF-like [Camellia sinensis]
MRDGDVDFFLEEGDNTTCIQTYLMSPLTGIRAYIGREADVPSSSRPRAADAPLTSRARVRRGSVRGIHPARQSVGWPDLLTELTSWQYSGEPYKIPIEPPLLGHRYVRTPNSPSVTPLPIGPAVTEAGPSAPSPTAGRERGVPARGRGRRQEPIMRDDDDETSEAETEEDGDQHTESSESEDDDTGSSSASGDKAELGSDAEDDDDSGSGSTSGSDSGVDGDSSAEFALLRKRTKSASRA